MSAQRREAILDEFEKSGAAGVPFAKMMGVNYQTFAGWVSRRRKARQRSPALAAGQSTHEVRFAEAVVVGEAYEKTVLTIELPGGARIHLSGSGQVDLMCHLLARLAKKETPLC